MLLILVYKHMLLLILVFKHLLLLILVSDHAGVIFDTVVLSHMYKYTVNCSIRYCLCCYLFHHMLLILETVSSGKVEIRYVVYSGNCYIRCCGCNKMLFV